jgi:hypothetical protein
MNVMTSIDRLIYDALAARRGVSLPGVGTLEVKRRGAKKISDTQIVPPQNVVVFNSGEVEDAVSVTSLITADRGVNEDEAGAQYNSWLEGARRGDGAVEIESVGRTGEGGFVVAEELHTALNPAGEEPVAMETEKHPNRLWLWILLGAVAGLLLLGVLCWQRGCFGSGRSKGAVVETVVPVTPPPAAEPEPVARVAPPSAPRFHVIAGAFAIESNADDYIARLKRDYPELTPEKVLDPGTGYNMVSILQAPTRNEASRKMNLWWDINLDLWIYQQK